MIPLDCSQSIALGALQTMRQEKLAKSMARESFRDFIPGAWKVIEPSKPLVKAWSIDAIADHLQAVADGYIQNLLINISPGSAKSNLCSVMFPAWMWIKKPWWRSTVASNESSLASQFSVKCRDLIKSDWYRESFDPKWTFASDQDEKTYYINSEKGHRMSTSVGGRMTGFRNHGLIIDDPSKADDQFSPAALDAVIRWWENTMYNRLIDMSTGTRVIVMQRLSDRDLSAHVLRQGACTHLLVPMEYDPSRSKVTVLRPGVEWKDPRKERGEIMTPVIFTRAVVDDLKKNPAFFSSQYQQAPTPEGGGILKAYKFNYWKPRGMDLPTVRVKNGEGTIEERMAVDLPEKFDLQLQSWDLSFKDLETSDFVVGFMIAVKGANRYIRDQIRGRMGLPATLAGIREMTARYPDAHLKLIEDKANGPAVIQTLQDEIPGLIPINPEGGKVVRASAASVSIESGNWYIPHPMVAAWVGDPADPTSKDGFLNEVATFPFGKNDDQCFVAGTMVATVRGNRPIETLKEGEFVVTPFGARRIVGCGPTGIRSVISVRGLTGTPDHPVFSLSGCFLCLDTLTQSQTVDTLSLCGLIRWNVLNQLNLMDGNIDSWGREGIISVSQRATRSASGLLDFMWLFGRKLMEQSFPKAATSIIKTATRLITILIIWSAYRSCNMLRFLSCIKIFLDNSSIWKKFARSLRNGIVRILGGNGIESMARTFGPEDLLVSSIACGAASRLPQSTMLPSAQTCAGIDIVVQSDITTSQEPVLHVEKNFLRSFRSIRPESAKPVHESARLQSSEQVYNLSVERDGVYYANGILVSNCDAWSQTETYLQKQPTIGGVFGVTESEIRVEPFELNLLEKEKWPRAYGLSITWHEVAAVWLARQPLTSQHCLYAEYCAQAGDPAQHAAAMKKLGDWPGYMTAEEQGRDARGGYALATKYNELGLKVETVPANDDAFLADFTEALRTGKIKVFGNLSRFFDQFRSFSRRDGKLPVYNRGLLDAAMVAWRCRDRLRKPPEPAKPSPMAYRQSPVGSSWMGK